MPSTFIIQQSENYYRFQFEGEHESILLFSRLFRSLVLCRSGIQELIASIAHGDNIEKILDKQGHWSFVVRNRKGIMLAHSASYYAESTRDYAVLQIKRQAEQAPIIENVIAQKNRTGISE